jgi:hypothetical protein
MPVERSWFPSCKQPAGMRTLTVLPSKERLLMVGIFPLKVERGKRGKPKRAASNRLSSRRSAERRGDYHVGL